jgi:hypothetical protein
LDAAAACDAASRLHESTYATFAILQLFVCHLWNTKHCPGSLTAIKTDSLGAALPQVPNQHATTIGTTAAAQLLGRQNGTIQMSFSLP